MKAKLPKAQPGRIIRNAVKKVVKTAPSSFKVSDAQIKKAITQTERQNFKDMFKKIDAQDALKKKMGGSSTMKKYQAKNSQVVRKNPYGKDFGQATDSWFKENVKTDYARPYYIKSDSFNVESNKKRKNELKNFKETNWESDSDNAQKYKKLADRIRKTQGLMPRNMEWDYKKGGAIKKKMGGMTKSKRK